MQAKARLQEHPRPSHARGPRRQNLAEYAHRGCMAKNELFAGRDFACNFLSGNCRRGVCVCWGGGAVSAQSLWVGKGDFGSMHAKLQARAPKGGAGKLCSIQDHLQRTGRMRSAPPAGICQAMGLVPFVQTLASGGCAQMRRRRRRTDHAKLVQIGQPAYPDAQRVSHSGPKYARMSAAEHAGLGEAGARPVCSQVPRGHRTFDPLWTCGRGAEGQLPRAAGCDDSQRTAPHARQSDTCSLS